MSDEVVVQVVVPEIVVQAEVAAVTISEVGAQGVPGPQGPAGVTVSDTPPLDTNVVWVDTSGL